MPSTFKSELSAAEKAELLKLWNSEYPGQLQLPDQEALDEYLDGLQSAEHCLHYSAQGQLSGWAFKFIRDQERWFAIILDSKLQRQGIGTQLLNALKSEELNLNGWVVDHDEYKKCNQQPYPSPVSFYLKNGFRIVPAIRLESDLLSAVKMIWDRPE